MADPKVVDLDNVIDGMHDIMNVDFEWESLDNIVRFDRMDDAQSFWVIRDGTVINQDILSEDNQKEVIELIQKCLIVA